MILSFRTDRSEQTVQTQIKGAVWSGSTLFAFHLHLLDTLLYGITCLFELQIFRVSENLGIYGNDTRYCPSLSVGLDPGGGGNSLYFV